LKSSIAWFAAAALAAGCGAQPETKSAAPAPAAPAAKATCAPPPAELVRKDLVAGAGPEVVLRSPTLVQYSGWLYDGCKPDFKGALFDSSEGRSTPFSFIAGGGRVIKGWDEGVIGVKEGGRRLLIIPPDKGYGAQGAGGGKIPPNATLVFEVTVVKVLQ
jgi:FKBP-type peptidyl-prolyl cis-trans isomerase